MDDLTARGEYGPLLVAKIRMPEVRRGLVVRPRLSGRLAPTSARRLTLVSAPAGFGKTTLLAAWLRERAGGASWISLDAGDNDPVRFLGYLLLALQDCVPGVAGAAMEALHTPQPPPTTNVLTTLANALATELDAGGAPHVLVLDDYHTIEAPETHEMVAFLLDALPPAVHLMIATRVDPPLPLSRLRARGQMAELRAADLRFTRDEAAAFLERTVDRPLTPEQVDALETRTEGWAVGLQMAALSLQGRSDAAQFVRTFSGSHRYVLDYLTEEVLNRQPPARQTFLLTTAVLDRLSGSLCDAVIPETVAAELGDAQAVLADLERANLFVVPLDDRRRWYRYHHLFAELLRARLVQSDPAAPRRLLTRAAAWCEQAGWHAEAANYALRAGDHRRAARIIEGLTWETLMRGELTTLLRWIEALPAETLAEHGQLRVNWAAALVFSGRIREAAAILDAVAGVWTMRRRRRPRRRWRPRRGRRARRGRRRRRRERCCTARCP